MNSKITQNQYTAIVINSFIGLGIVSLASSTSKKAHQCSWISVLVSGIFPFVLLLTVSYLSKKFNYTDFSSILKNLYGEFFNKIFLAMFFISSVIVQSMVISGYTEVLKLSISTYIPSLIILPLILLITVCTSQQQITILGRLCEISLCFAIPLLFTPLLSSNVGDKTNLMPYFESIESIVSSIPGSFVAYGGAEISFIILAYVTNKKSITKHNVFCATIVTLIYTFITAITVFFFGWKLTAKFKYSLLLVFKLVRPAVFSDFTSFFMIVWSTSILLTLSIEQFTMRYCMSNLFNLDFKKTNYINIPIIFLISLISIISNDFIVKILTPLYTIISVLTFIWCIMTIIFTFFKSKGEKNEES